MVPTRVDYAQLAPNYDERYAVYGLNGIRDTLLAMVERERSEYVLEIGCGSGYWLEVILDRVTKVYGMDYSFSMLRLARQPGMSTRLTQGDAVWLPYASNSLDLVFCVNAIHHFGNPAGYIGEVMRLLRSGGNIAVFGPDPHNDASDWYVYRYFPEAHAFDLNRFPRWDELGDLITQAGFTDVQFAKVDESCRFFNQDTVFEDPFLKKKMTSQLASLSDETYMEGIGRIRDAICTARMNGTPLGFRTDIPFYCLSASKP